MKNEIYDKVNRILTQRRQSAIAENDRRISEINEKIPEIREINNTLYSTGRELILAARTYGREGLQERIEELKRNNQSAQEMCKRLLVANGYPEDYLKVHFTCPVCRDTGSDGAKICECARQLSGRLMAESLNENAQLALSSFDTFSLDYYSGEDRRIMERILSFAKQYAAGFTPSSGNILMLGRTGLGKTHLSLAIANEVLQKGYSVLYDSVINILFKIQKESFSYDKNSEMLDTVMDVQLLILDDLGTEYENKMYSSTIYNIVNTRLNRGKPTIISTNMDFKQIAARYDERVVSRLTSMYDCFEFRGEDVRLQQKFRSSNK